jgi:four helix bundle protein
MTKAELKERFKQYAIGLAQFVSKLPRNVINNNYIDHLTRAGSSSAANYSAALRAKSGKDFINKLKIVEEELDESVFFLELIVAGNPAFKTNILPLRREGNELLSIIVKSIITLRKKHPPN